MLNTQKFNIGKFNILAGGSASQASAAFIQDSAMTASAYLAYSALAIVNAEGVLNNTDYSRTKQAQVGAIDALSDMTAQYYIRVPLYPLAADALSGMTAQTAAVYGVDIMSLPDLVLKPGQELVIDTDNMTVTLDGRNAIHLLSDDSVFFFLAQGEDLVTYSDNGNSRNINLKVMWKDRWL